MASASGSSWVSILYGESSTERLWKKDDINVDPSFNPPLELSFDSFRSFHDDSLCLPELARAVAAGFRFSLTLGPFIVAVQSPSGAVLDRSQLEELLSSRMEQHCEHILNQHLGEDRQAHAQYLRFCLFSPPPPLPPTPQPLRQIIKPAAKPASYAAIAALRPAVQPAEHKPPRRHGPLCFEVVELDDDSRSSDLQDLRRYAGVAARGLLHMVGGCLLLRLVSTKDHIDPRELRLLPHNRSSSDRVSIDDFYSLFKSFPDIFIVHGDHGGTRTFEFKDRRTAFLLISTDNVVAVQAASCLRHSLNAIPLPRDISPICSVQVFSVTSMELLDRSASALLACCKRMRCGQATTAPSYTTSSSSTITPAITAATTRCLTLHNVENLDTNAVDDFFTLFKDLPVLDLSFAGPFDTHTVKYLLEKSCLGMVLLFRARWFPKWIDENKSDLSLMRLVLRKCIWFSERDFVDGTWIAFRDRTMDPRLSKLLGFCERLHYQSWSVLGL